MTIEQTAYYCLSELNIHALPTMAGAPHYVLENIGCQIKLHDLGKPGIVFQVTIVGF